MNVKLFDLCRVKMPSKPKEAEEWDYDQYIVTVPHDECFWSRNYSYIYTYPPATSEDGFWEVDNNGNPTGIDDDGLLEEEQSGMIKIHVFNSFEEAKTFRDLARLDAQIRLIEFEHQWGYQSYARDVFEAVSRLSRRK